MSRLMPLCAMSTYGHVSVRAATAERPPNGSTKLAPPITFVLSHSGNPHGSTILTTFPYRPSSPVRFLHDHCKPPTIFFIGIDHPSTTQNPSLHWHFLFFYIQYTITNWGVASYVFIRLLRLVTSSPLRRLSTRARSVFPTLVCILSTSFFLYFFR